MKPRASRLPPHSLESEQAVIGCCLNTPKQSIAEAQIVIRNPEMFYDIRTQTLWGIIQELDPSAVNFIGIHQILIDRLLMGGIDIEFLNQCQDLADSSAHLPVWLAELQDKHARRSLIEVCAATTAEAYGEGSLTTLLDGAERDILAIRPNQRQENGIKALVQEAIGKIEYRFQNPDLLAGLPTGFMDLDRLTDGMHPGEMIVIAGFTSTGKTALAVNIATTNALAGVPVAIFTAEMLPVQIVVRQICATARANYKKLLEKDMVGLTNACAKIAYAPIHIQAANGLTCGQVHAMARRMKQKYGIKLIVVDYIQLLAGTGDNREQQISSISKAMKAMALELDCGVLALSQLTDEGKLRESRAIGHDADSVWKLANDGQWQPEIQPIKLNVEKCRDGETGSVGLTFLKPFTRFESASKVTDADMPPSQNNQPEL